MDRLRKSNLQLNPDKCEFLRGKVCYLGHMLNIKGVSPDPRKLEAVGEFPKPKNVKIYANSWAWLDFIVVLLRTLLKLQNH